MKQKIEYIEGTPTLISIKAAQSTKITRIILQIFMTISFAMPIIATIIAIFILELKPGILITYLIFGGTGYFFLKLFLWNKYGKEIFHLETDKIVYEADYKLFKGNKKEIKSIGFTLTIKESEGTTGKLGTITLTNKEINIESVIKVPVKELIEIKDKIEKYYA